MSEIKAIETNYKGYRFRSRLEARWAVFFDALGVKWEYEPEGFDLGYAGWYLPDFRVTSSQGMIAWYEIKPETEPESVKMKALEKSFRDKQIDPEGFEHLTSTSFSTLRGDPYSLFIEKQEKWVCPRCGFLIDEAPDFCVDQTMWTCLPCDWDTPCGSGHPSENGLLGEVTPHKGNLFTYALDTEVMLNRVRICAEKARQSRFEHGDNGLR